MKKVIKEKSLKEDYQGWVLNQIDFLDTFATTNHKNTVTEIANLIFNTMPVWIDFLFKIRNVLVSVVGLKTVQPIDYSVEYKIGGYIGFFRIYELKATEIVLGVNDKHLNFRVVVGKTKSEFYNVKITTLVTYHNKFGMVYMNVIKPFHKLVVKHMVKQAYRKP
ncbi:hypothetical protein FHR24_002537 [Wenyingzhuangia heitensis]|uniref:DUF2867 domain-containing protein n=1 Tax=Wenyingzhuangia heitensis TaxID=1487859 RepID=A0ABX0UCI8_9FLAO|nr:DUF2867 domain-containing protein [Wenyingzhuangia heitensis]NIJ46059.1 hypothetical protein [Wenyingzhuangia heitensis]